MSDSLDGLKNYYTEFIPKHFPLANGKPRSKRSAQKIAKKFNFDLIRVGHIVLIDPPKAAQRLRESAVAPGREVPRRGRPPKTKIDPVIAAERLREIAMARLRQPPRRGRPPKSKTAA